MAEYKDVAAIKTKIQKICNNCWHPYRLGGCPEHCGINDAVKAIDSAPTVDAVEVVRCRDCLYWQKSSLFRGHTVCRYVLDCSVVRREDDFCSRGERKDGDGNETD